MASLDEVVAETIEAFHAAAIGDLDWETPVRALADATGSLGGELIGLGRDCLVPFNLITGAAPEAAAEFLAAGGGNPAVNSRVRIGSQARELEVLDEAAFTTASDIRANPEYGEWIRRHQVEHVCLTPLVKEPHLLVGMAVMRGSRQGHIDAERKRVFAAIAPHVRRAVKTRMALQDQRLDSMMRGLTATRTAAFVCDPFGHVRAMTAPAEALARAGHALRLSHGRLTPRHHRDAPRLSLLIGEAFRGGAGPMRPIALHDADGLPVLIEAAPIPRDGVLSFGDGVLVIVHQPSDDQARMAGAAQALYGLSPSESLIAGLLATGRSVSAIAEQRRTSIGTVRSQVRKVFEKAGVSSQVELVASLARFR